MMNDGEIGVVGESYDFGSFGEGVVVFGIYVGVVGVGFFDDDVIVDVDFVYVMFGDGFWFVWGWGE